MATAEGPTARNLRAIARLAGIKDLPQHATKAMIAGAIAGAMQSLAKPGPGAGTRSAPHDEIEYRRGRIEYYLSLGFTQRAIAEALAHEDPPINVHFTTVSRTAAEIRERWKAQSVAQRSDTVNRQLAAWEARLGALMGAWAHEMRAYERQRSIGRPEDLTFIGGVGTVDDRQMAADSHLRSMERLHRQIVAIEQQRRDLMGLDAEESSGTFRDLLIATAEGLGWPEDAIPAAVAEAERLLGMAPAE